MIAFLKRREGLRRTERRKLMKKELRAKTRKRIKKKYKLRTWR
jgi:hypothetical protein